MADNHRHRSCYRNGPVGTVRSGNYRLGSLALMLWGAAVMVLVDHLIGYEGGPFVTMHTGGYITNSMVLGLVMLIPVLVIWQSMLLYDRFNKNNKKGTRSE